MALLGLQWRVAPADVVEEEYLLGQPAIAAVNVALARAQATSVQLDETVVAADTLVVLDGNLIGKPLNANEARAMLEGLRGRAHHVMTGVVVRSRELDWAGVVDTRVLMRNFRADEVQAYIARGEPFDKAGGYAVQDEAFRPVERLDGCYLNVVGLPLCAVASGLNAVGTPVPSAGPPRCRYCEAGAELVRSGS